MAGPLNTRLHLCTADIWTEERLEAPTIGELISHGGNKSDIKQLKAEFQKDRGNKSDTNENMSAQIRDIPS